MVEMADQELHLAYLVCLQLTLEAEVVEHISLEL
jgi:hypothetical protein